MRDRRLGVARGTDARTTPSCRRHCAHPENSRRTLPCFPTNALGSHVRGCHRSAVGFWIAAHEQAGPLVLVGHSLGARLAVTYAARNPDQIAQVVLVSMPYFGRTESAKGYFGRRGAEGWIMTHMMPAAIACLVSRRLLGWALPSLIRDVPREVAEDLNQTTWRSSTSTLWEVIYDYDLRPDFASVEGRIPMLCLHGDRDESAPLGPIRELASSHRDCLLRVYVGASHALPLEQPAWVRAQISSVLPAKARS